MFSNKLSVSQLVYFFDKYLLLHVQVISIVIKGYCRPRQERSSWGVKLRADSAQQSQRRELLQPHQQSCQGTHFGRQFGP